MGWASSGAASVVVAEVRSFVPGASFGHLLQASRNYREFKGNASAYPRADTQRGGKMIGSAVRISALALGSLDQLRQQQGLFRQDFLPQPGAPDICAPTSSAL